MTGKRYEAFSEDTCDSRWFDSYDRAVAFADSKASDGEKIVVYDAHATESTGIVTVAYSGSP